MSTESLLQQHQLRPFPIALGQVLANAKPGPRLDCLNRLYMGLKPADRLRCRDELNRCRAAKRGAQLAEIA